MVKFGKFERNDAGLTDLGTLKAVVGKGGKIAFIRKNYNDESKRVAVVLTNKGGDSAVVSCSKQVSDALRAKQINLAQLAGLNVLENAEGVAFISMPATGALQEFSIDKINVEAVETVSADFLPEETIA